MKLLIPEQRMIQSVIGQGRLVSLNSPGEGKLQQSKIKSGGKPMFSLMIGYSFSPRVRENFILTEEGYSRSLKMREAAFPEQNKIQNMPLTGWGLIRFWWLS